MNLFSKGLAMGAALVVAVGLTAGCASSDEQPKESGAAGTDQLTIGIYPNNTLSLTVIVAEEAGMFEDAGLEVEMIGGKGGVEAVSALIGGTTQIAMGGPANIIPAMEKGQDLVAVPVYQDLDYVLVATKAGGVKDVSDLKGKNIGVTALGGAAELYAREIIAQEGMNPDDSTYIAIGPSAAQAPALKAGQVDATVLSLSSVQAVEGQGAEITPIANAIDGTAGKVGDYGLGGLWMTTQTFIDSHPKVIEKYCTAMDEVVKWMADDANKAEGSKIVADLIKVPLDAAEKLWDELHLTYHMEVDADRWALNAKWITGSKEAAPYKTAVYGGCGAGK